MKKSFYLLGIVFCFMMVVGINLATADQAKVSPVAEYCHQVAVQKGTEADIMNPAVPEQTRRALIVHWFNTCMDEQKEGK